jgi:hypothetical protein
MPIKLTRVLNAHQLDQLKRVQEERMAEAKERTRAQCNGV